MMNQKYIRVLRWIAIGLVIMLAVLVITNAAHGEELSREKADDGLPECQEGDLEEEFTIDVCQLRKAVFALKAYPILLEWKDELSNEVTDLTEEYNQCVEDFNEHVKINLELEEQNEKLKTANTVLISVLVPTGLTAIGLGIWAISQGF
jgi:hypothetical protein